MKFVALAVQLRSSVARALGRRPSRTLEWTEEDTFSDPFRWQTVTILATPDEIAPDGQLPAPLAGLAEVIDTRLEPAPGGRGSQLSARTKLRPKPDSTLWKGEDPSRQIRSALQHAKQLVEVGEVLSVEPQPAGKRRRRAGLLVDLMSGDSDQEGVV
ncbi:MAG TPA: hypothetical protein VF714_09875 [Jatrophihabitans sp.]|jgi:hypothetical protein